MTARRPRLRAGATGSRRDLSPAAAEPDALTVVRELEQSIATRRTAVEQARTEVRQAETEAAQIIMVAQQRAQAEAGELRDQILERARAEATVLEQRAGDQLVDLGALAEAERSDWVEVVAADVLGRTSGSGAGALTGPPAGVS